MGLPLQKLQAGVARVMSDVFLDKGFAPVGEGGMERWRGGVYFYVGAIVDRVGEVNRIEAVGQLGFGDVKRISSAFMADDPDKANKIAVHLQVRHCHFTEQPGSHFVCQEEAELPGFLDSLKRFFTEKLLPVLEAHTDPKKVLDLYLSFDEKDVRSCKLPGWFGYSSALGALALARLHGPAHYGELKQRYMSYIRPLIPEIRDRAMDLISYLDQEPLPPLKRGVLNDHSI